MDKSERSKVIKTLTEVVDTSFDEVSGAMADLLMQEQAHKGPQLLPEKARRDQLKAQIQKELKAGTERLENGIQQILQRLITLKNNNNEELFSDQVASELGSLFNLMQMIQEDQEGYARNLQEGKSPSELIQMSDTTLEALYQAAKHLYEEKKYQEAADAFTFLTFLNPYQYVFWLGLGNAEMWLNNHQAACLAFEYCIETDHTQPFPYYNLAECLEHLKNYDRAQHVLEETLKLIGADKEHADLKSKIQNKLQMIKHTLQK